MTTRTRAGRVMNVYKLDSKPYADTALRMQRLVDRVLGPYGEPVMSLAELRATLGKQLRKVSLSELVLKEREAGW